MPRDIPVGNGNMLVTFDQHYQVRDLYYPHVGQDNHAGGGPCRFGVWAALPRQAQSEDERRRQRVYWSDDRWAIAPSYETDTLATHVTLTHPDLMVELRCSDVVDFHRPVLIRRIEVADLAGEQDREFRLFHHHDFHLYGTKVGDTAYYDPQLRSLIHYRKARYIMCCFYAEGDQQIEQYATGNAGFQGAEGTWRDAEDGELGNNAIAQGAVDSTMMCQVHVPAGGMRVVYMVIGCGQNNDDMEELHRFLHRNGPQGVIDRTKAYWRLWLAASCTTFPAPQVSGLGEKVAELFKRSLVLVRTQIDNNGAIIAANDSDIMQFSRDTYSYLWPRDGAFVADALDAAGFSDVSRQFFSFCATLITKRGHFLHKYAPDGSPASSWHPWVLDGRPSLPIQEDETALVVWALWRHYVRYRDIEFVRPLWIKLIQPAADFLVRFRDPATKLPLPSYDLWEERFGVHAFTVATVYGGLKAAWQFAVCFGDNERAGAYAHAAEELRQAFCKYMWSDQHDRFLRRVEATDRRRTARFVGEVLAHRTPQLLDESPFDELKPPGFFAPPGDGQTDRSPADEIEMEHDQTIDASMFAIFAMGLLPVDDPRVVKTMKAIEDRLWVKTDVGGLARYEDDYYHQVARDTEKIPGNPWFICTLWLADYHIARAHSHADLRQAGDLIHWVADHALPSGVLAEQVHPVTGAPLSVSPLTWSHATVVATVIHYLIRLDETRMAGSSRDTGEPGARPTLSGMLQPRAPTPVTSPVPDLEP